MTATMPLQLDTTAVHLGISAARLKYASPPCRKGTAGEPLAAVAETPAWGSVVCEALAQQVESHSRIHCCLP